MSTQTSGFPPLGFSSTYPQETFRLMELPPDLVTLVEAQGDTSRPVRLQFKSTAEPSRSHNLTDSSAQGFLHLCSHDKVWAVKQVSTSNSVYVTRIQQPQNHNDPQMSAGDPRGEGDEDTPMDDIGDPSNEVHLNDLVTQGGISTVAQVKNILELVQVQPNLSTIQDNIVSMVGYSNDASDDQVSDGSSLSINDVFENIAASNSAIATVAKKLFICLTGGHQPTPSSVIIPSSSTLLDAWKEFIQECNIRGVNIDGDLNGATVDSFGPILTAISNNDSTPHSKAFPGSVNTLHAIFRQFKLFEAATDNDKEDITNLLNNEWNNTPVQGGWDAEELTLSIGLWILQSPRSVTHGNSPEDQSLPVEAFTEQWLRLTPDTWARHCQISTLISRGESTGLVIEIIKKASNRKEVGEKTAATAQNADAENTVEFIRLARASGSDGTQSASNGFRTTNSSGQAAMTAAASKQDTATDSKKRKWHDKFSKMRNVKK